MFKAILLAILLGLVFAQSTGLGDSVAVGSGSEAELPSAAPPSQTSPINPASTPDASGSGGSGSQPVPAPSPMFRQFIIRPQQPQNWRFLLTSVLGLGSKWVAPTPDYEVKPLRYLATYTISFHTDCPQSQIAFKFAATGSVFVYLNGKSILEWGNPYPTILSLQLKKPDLKCGCNTIKVYVYNYYYASPAAFTYGLAQDTSNCYNCKNLGVTFYNKKTCQCECASECQCKNPAMRWSNYPQCGCSCAANIVCRAPQYADLGTCSCKCPETCCPSGTVQNPNTCQCQRPCQRVLCQRGYEWDQNQCKCVSICGAVPLCLSPRKWNPEKCECECSGAAVLCMSPKIWDKTNCKCTCPRTLECPRNYYFDTDSCQCKCGIMCIATLRFDPVNCRCLPL